MISCTSLAILRWLVVKGISATTFCLCKNTILEGLRDNPTIQCSIVLLDLPSRAGRVGLAAFHFKVISLAI